MTHRRDSINAQLHNVREMLATLTGGAVNMNALAALSEAEDELEKDDDAIPAQVGPLSAAPSESRVVAGVSVGR